MYSTSEPYDILCDDHVDKLVIQLPYDAVLTCVPHAALLTGLAISAQDDVGGLVSAQLQKCAATIRGQSEVVQRHKQDMMIDLVTTGLSSLSQSHVDLARPEQLLLARAKTTIRTHLRDHALDRDYVAAAMGISARNLGRFFAREGLSVAA